jgi:pectate lyase C
MKLRQPLAALVWILAGTLGCGDDAPTDADPDNVWSFDGAVRATQDASSTDAAQPRPEAGVGAPQGTGPQPEASTPRSDAAAPSPEPDAALDAGGDPGTSTRDAGSDAAAPARDAGSDAAPERDAGSDASTRDAGTTIGNGGTLSATVIVKSGEVFDGMNKRYTAGSALGDGSQSESQKPMFRLEDGATLRNVVLGSPAADGVHTYGNVTLQNIVWEDIGEDALTIKESGTVVLNGGSARNGEDKVFQINAASTFRVSNFTAQKAGKFIRQNGNTTFTVKVYIDRCDISQMSESIFRTDSSSSTVSMTNTRYSQIGDRLFYGVNANNITQSGNTQY